MRWRRGAQLRTQHITTSSFFSVSIPVDDSTIPIIFHAGLITKGYENEVHPYAAVLYQTSPLAYAGCFCCRRCDARHRCFREQAEPGSEGTRRAGREFEGWIQSARSIA